MFWFLTLLKCTAFYRFCFFFDVYDGGGVINNKSNIKNSNDLITLIDFLEQTINKLKHELKDWALADLWKFHAELVKYKEELEAQDT